MTTNEAKVLGLNPFKDLRAQSDLTLEHLAHNIGISKQALIRLEQGTFSDPLPTALNYFATNFHLSELELIQRYEAYQHAQREAHERYFGDVRLRLNDADVLMHPLRILRGKRTPTQVSKDLCIPQATLVYFERNVVQQKSVPKMLTKVMREIGHYKSEVDAFIVSYEFHRNVVITQRESEGKRITYGYQSRQSRQSRQS